MHNITNRLLPNKDRSDELEVFLGTRGGTSKMDERKVAYEEGRLVVEYNKRHQITSIQVAEDYGDSRIRRLEDEVAAALSEAGTEVRQRYLHSLYQTDGFLRHEDEFQILPSPPDAPQPDSLYAKHSFLLEYRYSKSPNLMVSRHRSDRRFSELSLLLNALLQTLTIRIGTIRKEWVVSSVTDGGHYLQLGYFGGKEHRPKAADGFSSTDDLSRLSTVDAQSYYTQLGVTPGDPLQIPDSFTKSLLAYERLDDESKAKFCRASYWTQVSSQLYPISQSASYAALVSAIEVFLPESERCPACGRPTSTENCRTCNQPSSGVTKQFRDFVDKYGCPQRRRGGGTDIRTGTV